MVPHALKPKERKGTNSMAAATTKTAAAAATAATAKQR